MAPRRRQAISNLRQTSQPGKSANPTPIESNPRMSPPINQKHGVVPQWYRFNITLHSRLGVRSLLANASTKALSGFEETNDDQIARRLSRLNEFRASQLLRWLRGPPFCPFWAMRCGFESGWRRGFFFLEIFCGSLCLVVAFFYP